MKIKLRGSRGGIPTLRSSVGIPPLITHFGIDCRLRCLLSEQTVWEVGIVGLLLNHFFFGGGWGYIDVLKRRYIFSGVTNTIES